MKSGLTSNYLRQPQILNPILKIHGESLADNLEASNPKIVEDKLKIAIPDLPQRLERIDQALSRITTKDIERLMHPQGVSMDKTKVQAAILNADAGKAVEKQLPKPEKPRSKQ